jgi:hypothetical protein
MGIKREYVKSEYKHVEESNEIQNYKKMAEACGLYCMLEKNDNDLYIFSRDKNFLLGSVHKPFSSGYVYETFEDVQITQYYRILENSVNQSYVNVVSKITTPSFEKLIKQVKKLDLALKQAIVKQRLNSFEGDFENEKR